MNIFQRKEIDSINYSQLYSQPVKFFQNRRNVPEFSQSNNNTCSTDLNVLQLRNRMLGCIIQQRVAIVYFTAAPNDGFPLNTFKTLFRLSRVLLDLQKRILSSVVDFVSDCMVILGQLESLRNYKGFSIIFPKILDAI